jgi:hypothetical protein
MFGCIENQGFLTRGMIVPDFWHDKGGFLFLILGFLDYREML